MTGSFAPAHELWISSQSPLSSDEVSGLFNSIQKSLGDGETYHFRKGGNQFDYEFYPSNRPEDVFNSFQKSVDSNLKWSVVASICKIKTQTVVSVNFLKFYLIRLNKFWFLWDY